MSTDLVQNRTPEEQELERKNVELASFEADLIQRELDLATLRADLAEFEARYLRQVGVLYAELDEIEARIAEAQASRMPSDPGAREQAVRARAQADESSLTMRAIAEPKSKPTESLKRLFREVAKCIHPDLATNDADRTHRQILMAEANRAYEEGDEAKLWAILYDWKTSPDSIAGEGVGPELIRVIRKISQIRRRLAEIETERQQLCSSDIYQLWVKQKEAEEHGQDVLTEIAMGVEMEIDAVRKRLAAIVDRI